jgi:YidC/Oxa1 family membrane protein insertase
MDLQRIFLFLIFAFSLMMIWDGWQRHTNPVIQQGISSDVSKPQAQSLDSPGSSVSNTSPVPELPATNKSSGQVVTTQLNTLRATGKRIHVKTDLLEAEISTIGGDIDRLALLNHPDALDKSKPLVLFQRGKGTHNYIAQSGLLGADLPNHNSMYVSERDQYELSGNAEQVQVRLKADGDSKLKVTKVITFHKGSYLIEVAYELENTGQQAVSASSYYQLVRDSIAPAGSMRFLPTYTGIAVYTDKEKYKKVDFTAIEQGKAEYPKQADNGWIGILQHYFVAAWLPKEKTDREYFTRKLDGDSYAVGLVMPGLVIEPGQKAYVSSSLYAGPTESSLDKIAPGLGLTVDYGWLTIIANPLFWVMTLFNSWVHNWGIAIILLTVLIKLIFFPLSAASYRSMAKMRLVAPKLEKIKQQHGDDREQLNRAMMDLYKTEKINPLGGCLPVLVQIPVFIALYWAILSSVEMRNAPFFGWITDLSIPDPYYVLPLIMGASMIVQMGLNPKPPDPLQAKVMQIMPIAFSVIFFFFPAGLVLYSIVNNLLSIAQQWVITRNAEKESKGVVPKR